eukprot:3861807-Amphidinium_carterae.1
MLQSQGDNARDMSHRKESSQTVIHPIRLSAQCSRLMVTMLSLTLVFGNQGENDLRPCSAHRGSHQGNAMY